MALTVKHTFVSAKGDGSDATLVRPSNWNANHDIELASNRIIGRLTAGPGDAEELPVTPYMVGLLNTADYLTLAALLGLPTTGDAKLTFKLTADAGWVMANDGSIGDMSSGATVIHATTLTPLFTFFYNTFSDVICPVQTSAGAGTTRATQGTATAAFNNHCRMVLPKTLGRALIVGGAGAGLTNRVVGTTGGAEVHQLTLGEMASHGHSGTPTGTISTVDINHTHTQQGTFGSGNDSPDHTHYTSGTALSGYMIESNPHSHGVNGGVYGGSTTYGRPQSVVYDGYIPLGATAIGINNTDVNHRHYDDWGATSGGRSVFHQHSTTISGATGNMNSNNTHSHTFTGNLLVFASVGGDGAHNNMQPWTAWNVMIKL